MLSRYLSLLISAKYYREANNVLRDAIDRDPKNDALKADLIRITADLDGVDTAVSRANLYAKDNPKDSIFPLVAAEMYENAGRWSDATNLLEAAAAAHPSDGTLTTALAALYDRTGHFAKAEALLAGQLKANPQNAQAAALLGSLYLKARRSADAQRIYDALLAQKSNDFAARLGLADVAIFENKWSEAADQIKQAARLNPKSAAPGLKLVDLYIRSRDWKNATATATDLAAKFPDNIDVIDAAAHAQIGAGDKQAAIASYQHAYELDPNSSKILARYVGALNSAKKYAEAQSILRQALDREPQSSAIKADLIQVAADIGGVDAGLAEARDLARKDPDNLIYDRVSADLLDKAGRGKEAIGLLERDLASKPTNDEVRAQLATLYIRAGQPDKAQTLLSARLKDDPTDYPAAQMLASLYLQGKNYDLAISQYNELLQSRPTDPTALNNLAWLYQQKGDLTKARDLAERAAAAAPNAPQIDDTLGWILLAQGDATKAMTYLTAANVSAPVDPSIAYHLAVALQRAGHSADAQTVLEKLLGSGAAFAEKPEAEKLLADIKHS
jgi:predicted Zn-dependent protease